MMTQTIESRILTARNCLKGVENASINTETGAAINELFQEPGFQVLAELYSDLNKLRDLLHPPKQEIVVDAKDGL